METIEEKMIVNYNSDEEMSPTRKRLPDIQNEGRRWKKLKTIKLVLKNTDISCKTVSIVPETNGEIFQGKGGNSIMNFMEYHTNDISEEMSFN